MRQTDSTNISLLWQPTGACSIINRYQVAMSYRSITQELPVVKYIWQEDVWFGSPDLLFCVKPLSDDWSFKRPPDQKACTVALWCCSLHHFLHGFPPVLLLASWSLFTKRSQCPYSAWPPWRFYCSSVKLYNILWHISLAFLHDL